MSKKFINFDRLLPESMYGISKHFENVPKDPDTLLEIYRSNHGTVYLGFVYYPVYTGDLSRVRPAFAPLVLFTLEKLSRVKELTRIKTTPHLQVGRTRVIFYPGLVLPV